MDIFSEKTKEDKGHVFIFAILGVLMLASVVVSQFHPYLALISVLSVIFLFILTAKLEWGLYLMVIFLPVINWHFIFYGLEIPFIDLLSLVVLIAFSIRFVYVYFFNRINFKIFYPVILPFSIFFIAMIISSIFSDRILENIWYSVRWVLFPYLAYIFVPVNLIKRGQTLKKIMAFFMISGVAVSIMGFASLFVGDSIAEFIRVKPLAILEVYPLGNNHNLIAEILTVTSFFTLALTLWIKNSRLSRLTKLLVVFQWVILLLTFSRAAWLALLFQVLAYFYIQGKEKIKRSLPIFLIIAVMLLPVLFYMYKLQSDYTIGVSSTENRMLMYEIAWDGFKEKPLTGQGSGSFISLVDENIRFKAQYGDPLDSHGIWQKVLTENGLIGILAFVYAFVYLIRMFNNNIHSFKEKRKKLLTFISLGILGIAVVISFNTSYYKGKFFMPLGVGLAALNMINIEKNEKKD